MVLRRARRHAAVGERTAAADHGGDRGFAGRSPARPAPARRHDALVVGLDALDRPDREGPHTVVISFTDVTEEREALAALERSNLELQQFAYVASHDLSEPLRMVSSYLNLLRRRYRGRLDPDADEFIEYAVDGAARMRALIEGLLAYSRAGRSEEKPEPVELGSVTADVLRSLAAAMVEAGAEIEISDLPVVMGVPRAARAAAAEPDGQRAEVPRRRPGAGVGARGGRGARYGADRGRRRRHRHRAARARARLRDVRAPARPRDLRGHGHRAGDLPQDRRAPRRADLGR